MGNQNPGCWRDAGSFSKATINDAHKVALLGRLAPPESAAPFPDPQAAVQGARPEPGSF